MTESSDRALLDLIRRAGPLTVAELATSLGVTATAIRNRLTRLLGAGLVGAPIRASRPRPPQAYVPGQRRGTETAGAELC